MKYSLEMDPLEINVVDDICDWLWSEIGDEEQDWNWYMNYDKGIEIFTFKHDEDKVKFILRWS